MCPGSHPRGDSISNTSPKPIFLFPNRPWAHTMWWSPTFGHVLDPASYSGDSTRDREIDFKCFVVYHLWLFLYFLCIFLHSLHLFTHCALQFQINSAIVFALLPTFHSNLVVEYSIIVTPTCTYPRWRLMEVYSCRNRSIFYPWPSSYNDNNNFH